MAGKGIGNLWVTVGANVTPAINEIDKLNKKAMRSGAILEKYVGGGRTGQGTDQLKRKVKGLGDEFDRTSRKTRRQAESFQRVSKSAQAAGKPVANLQGAMYRLSQSFINLRYGNPIGVLAGLLQSARMTSMAMRGLAGAMGAVIKVAAVATLAIATLAAGVAAAGAAFAKFGVKAAADIEMLTTQYTGLLGSAQTAAAEVQYLLELGKESIVPTEGLLEANRLLLAYGVTADGTRRQMLEFFSVFGSATGLSAARLQDMAYALGQINTQGRANQIDMRQLANAGLNLASVYETIAEQQGISVAAARELSSEGKLYAEVVIPAVLAQTDRYRAGAEEARRTARGIWVNLQDIAKINIGRAFDGVLEKLKPLLLWAEEFIESFDFTAVASGIGLAIDGIKAGLQDVDISAENAALSIGQGLGNAFRQVGIIAGNVILITRKSMNVFQQFGQSAELLILRLERAQLWLERAGVAAGVAFGTRTQADLDAVDAKIKAVEDAAWDAYNGVDALEKELAALNGLQVEVGIIVRQRTLAEQAKFNTLGAEGKSSKAQGFTYDYTPPVREEKSGSGAKKQKKEVNELEKALKSLTSVWQTFKSLAAKPLGSDSQIEKALRFGDADASFQGNASQVVSMYSKMRGAAAEYFDLLIDKAPKAQRAALKSQKSKALKGMERDYQRLYNLATRNEELKKELADWKKAETDRLNGQVKALTASYNAEVKATEAFYDKQIDAAESALDRATEAYDSANSKLQALISERDSYLNGIRESAFSFVNALNETNEAISKVTELDSVGSFSSVTGEATVDFKAQLRDRLEAVKQWRADIETLLARGLDRNLMDALIEAGPDGSGALASALANETDAGIAEINSIQAELTGAVSGLQSSVSAAFFDQGIAQQQAFTNQMAANVASAQAYLDQQKALREQALAQLAADYEARKAELEKQIETVEAAEDEHSKSLIASMEENAKTANAIAAKIQESTAKLSNKKEKNNLFSLGKKAIQGLIDGMESKRAAAIATARSIANAIKAEMKGAFQIQSPSRVMMGYGENISEGLAIGMENGISKVDMATARLANAAFINNDNSRATAAPTVKVFIGDQELRDLVDVQITDASGRDLDIAYAGRRDF